MIRIIKSPSIIKGAGTSGKIIREIFGRVNSITSEVSIAHMISPEGWEEPGQCPEFNEYTYVIKGKLKINTKAEEYHVKQGEAILTPKDEWVKYSTPFDGGAEYIAVCLPAFSTELANRDTDN